MSKFLTTLIVTVLALDSGSGWTESAPGSDAAAAFGARPGAVDVSLSPDGSKAAYIGPLQGQGTALYTVGLESGAKPKAALGTDGKPLPYRLIGARPGGGPNRHPNACRPARRAAA